MSGSRKKLSANQERALASLLIYPTILSAARNCGLHESTLRRYLKDPVFVARYEEERAGLLDETISAIQKLGIHAAKALNDGLDQEAQPIHVRLRASRQVLDLILRDREFRAKIEGKIKDGAEVHISLSEHPEWQRLQELIFQALDPYPEASMAILRAIHNETGGTSNGHG